MTETKEQKISRLAKECLETKWNSESDDKVKYMCNFCYDAIVGHDTISAEERCKICICPAEICGNGGKSGYISFLFQDSQICKLDPEKLEYMRNLFKKHIIDD
jgi:hypothetical protein